MARANLGRFIEEVSSFRPARHHRLLIKELEAVERGETKRLMVFMPPGSAKSTYGSVLFPPYFLGRHPELNIIAASHTTALAERWGRRVRNLVLTPDYRRIFPVTLAGDSQAAGLWSTSAGGEYIAAGVGMAIAGNRADGVVIDDPIKGREAADSPTQRESLWSWYTSDLWPRLKPGAWIILIVTRWHEDDLAGRLLDEMGRGGEQWRVLSLPMIAEADDAMGRRPGEPLWPEWFTDAMRAHAQRETRTWSALYQQRPTPESGDYFKREWLRWYDQPPPRSQLRIYGASDYAVTADGGDWTVHLVAGVDPNDDLYILDMWREQTASDEWVEAFLDLVELWKPVGWAEEAGQIEKGVGPFLLKRSRERQVYVAREQFPSATDKATRAQSIRGRFAQGKVLLPRGNIWADAIVNEMLRFPAGKHDDTIDSLSLLGRVLDRMSRGDRPKPPPSPINTQPPTLDDIWARQGVPQRDHERI